MSQTHPVLVFIYTALPCEAKPLVEHFKLKKHSTSVFAVYYSENIILTVTGLGKTAMSAGIAYTQALFANACHAILLNVGIAGHQQAAIGSLYLVDKNTDMDSQKHYYPPIVFESPCASTALQTAAQPQLGYDQAALYDMEASAFFETAARFNTGEFNHSLKVVSDNRDTPASIFQPQHVSALIAAHLETVTSLIKVLQALVNTLPVPNPEDEQVWLQQYRLTASEQIQLKKLLSRWHVLTGSPLPDSVTAGDVSGKVLLRQLEQQLAQLDFHL